jgi:hypothetical protein
MALDRLVRRGVAIASRQTRSLQDAITHFAYVSQDLFGKKTFNPPSGTSRKCLIEQRVQKRKLPGGQEVDVQAALLFLEPIPAQGTAGRVEPIDPRDEIVLPDGSTGPIIYVSGPEDPKTDRPFVLQVWLGIRGGAAE